MAVNVIILTKLFPDYYRPYYGTLVFNLAKKLNAREGINLIVIRPIPFFPRILGIFHNRIKLFSKHPLENEIDGIKIYYPRYLKFPGSFKLFENIFIKWTALKIIKNKFSKVDIIYSHWVYPDAVAGYEIAKKVKARLLIHFHASDPSVFLKTKRIKKLSTNVLKNAYSTIFVSKGILDATLKIFNVNKPTVIHNGLDNNFFKPAEKFNIRRQLNIDTSFKVLLSVAYLKPAKGIDIVIKALSELSDESIHYYIVGWGEELKNLQNLARTLNVQEKVHFEGRKTNEEVRMWMQAADVLVQPSRLESFGQVFVEALMCGTPVIGTNIGGIPEIVKDNLNGFLIQPNNVSELIGAINKALTKYWNKSELIESVNEFTLDNMADKVAAIIMQTNTLSIN